MNANHQQGPNHRLADDAELLRVTAYVGGFMTEAEALQFEQDLKDDEELFDRVAPFLKVWRSRAPMFTAAASRQRTAVRRASEQMVSVPAPSIGARPAFHARRRQVFIASTMLAAAAVVITVGRLAGPGPSVTTKAPPTVAARPPVKAPTPDTPTTAIASVKRVVPPTNPTVVAIAAPVVRAATPADSLADLVGAETPGSLSFIRVAPLDSPITVHLAPPRITASWARPDTIGIKRGLGGLPGTDGNAAKVGCAIWNLLCRIRGHR